jgi:AcrR family transcriptional regulator
MEDVSATKGRPRDPNATKKILEVALDLAFAGGISNATVERIAECAGVARSTIYRRWPNAASIVMDAFLEELGPLIGYDKRYSIVSVVKRNLQHLVNSTRGPRGELLRHLIGAMQTSADLKQAFLDKLIEPRRKLALETFERAIKDKQLRPQANPEIILDLLYGAIYYRLFVSFRPLDAAFVDDIVGQAFQGVTYASARP